MFDYSLTHWATFLTAAVLLNLSPGPDIAFILGQTAKRGVQSGFSAMFGIWAGAFIHVIFAALGLSAVLATSALAFSAVKWIDHPVDGAFGKQGIGAGNSVSNLSGTASVKKSLVPDGGMPVNDLHDQAGVIVEFINIDYLEPDHILGIKSVYFGLGGVVKKDFSINVCNHYPVIQPVQNR